MIRLLLASDRRRFPSNLKSALVNELDVEIVGEVYMLNEVHSEVQKMHPQVVVFDVAVVDSESIQMLRLVRGQECRPQIMTVLPSEALNSLHNLRQTGMHGALLNYEDPRLIVEAVRLVVSGRTWFSPEITRWLDIDTCTISAGTVRISLTERELTILRMVAQEKTNVEIASSLHISTKTVDGELHSIFSKLSVKSRTGAVAAALRMQLL